MKIDKKLIKELVDNLDEFKLTELEYQNGETKIKVSKASKVVVSVHGSESVLIGLLNTSDLTVLPNDDASRKCSC